MEGIILLSNEHDMYPSKERIKRIVETVKSKSGVERIHNVNVFSKELNLEKGIQRLVATGAKTIKVIPMFFTKNTIYSVNIPIELRYIASKYYNIEIKMGQDIVEDEEYSELHLLGEGY